MARKIIGSTRLSQRTSGSAINDNFKELYELVGNGGGGSTPSALVTVENKTANYTVVSGDSAKILKFTSTSNLTLTLPNNLPLGFQVAIVQNSTGSVSVTAASGASFVNRQGYTKTAGQNAILSLVVIENTGGSAAKYLLTGDGVA